MKNTFFWDRYNINGYSFIQNTKNNPKIKICSRYDFENGYWIYDDIGFGLSK